MGADAESDTYTLSPEQKQFYADNGYLIIKGFFGEPFLDKLRDRFHQVATKKIPRGRISVITDVQKQKTTDDPEQYVNKINQLSYDEVFMEYTEHPRLMHVLSQLIGDGKTVLNSMLINKPPGSSGHPPHQDIYNLPFGPEERILTTWTAIDPAEQEHGCIYVVPGSHKAGKIYEEESVNDYCNTLFCVVKDADQIAPETRRLPLPVQPGDTVVFHSLMIHGSWANESQRCRKAITCVYGARCDFIDVTGTVREHFKRELEKEIRQRGSKMTHREFFETRAKMIPENCS